MGGEWGRDAGGGWYLGVDRGECAVKLRARRAGQVAGRRRSCEGRGVGRWLESEGAREGDKGAKKRRQRWKRRDSEGGCRSSVRPKPQVRVRGERDEGTRATGSMSSFTPSGSGRR